jgi:SAM-dependent methyltransferase
MNRVDREKNSYNAGILKRSRYEKLFQRSLFDSQYLDRVIHSNMAYADGKVALELGSNAWIGYLRDNIRPKKLYCINISEKELNQGLQYQRDHAVPFPVEFILMDANKPSFDVDSIDFVFGGAILHHLDFSSAVRNMAAVIKPHGRLLFHEPLGRNPVAKLIRLLTPFARTTDERPLSWGDIGEIKHHFDCRYYVSGGISTVTAIFTRILTNRTDTIADRWASRIDQVFARNRWISTFYREIVISGVKK